MARLAAVGAWRMFRPIAWTKTTKMKDTGSEKKEVMALSKFPHLYRE